MINENFLSFPIRIVFRRSPRRLFRRPMLESHTDRLYAVLVDGHFMKLLHTVLGMIEGNAFQYPPLLFFERQKQKVAFAIVPVQNVNRLKIHNAPRQPLARHHFHAVQLKLYRTHFLRSLFVFDINRK